jgi:hypothetical protein
VNRELRELVTGTQTARLAPDLLAKSVGVNQLVGANGHRIETLEEAEFGKFTNAVRKGVYAHPQLPYRVSLLVNVAFDAPGVKHEARREPADAASHNDNLHGRPRWDQIATYDR